MKYMTKETLPYLGQEYRIEIKKYLSYKKPGIRLEKDKLVVLAAAVKPEQIETAFREWYIGRAKTVIPQRVAFYQDLLKEEVSGIRIKDVKSRWGSCSSKRNLNFNWRLVMAPQKVLDYVVIHELCHLKEMNHSPAFWGLVEAVMPDYKQQREWLKKWVCPV